MERFRHKPIMFDLVKDELPCSSYRLIVTSQGTAPTSIIEFMAQMTHIFVLEDNHKARIHM